MRPWPDATSRERSWQLQQLPGVLHGLSRALRAGATLPAAIAGVAADSSVGGAAFAAMAERVAHGAPVVDEIDRWAAWLDDPDADLVRAVINTGTQTGSALAASFDRAADSLQERAELAREIRALSAQARMSALVLTLAPPVFLAVMSMLDPVVLRTVIATGSGRAAVLVGVALDGAGWWWMRRLASEVGR